MQVSGFIAGDGQEVHTAVLIGKYVYGVRSTFKHFSRVGTRGLVEDQGEAAFLLAIELDEEGSVVIKSYAKAIFRSGLVGNDYGASLCECLLHFECYVPSVSDLHLNRSIQDSSCNFEGDQLEVGVKNFLPCTQHLSDYSIISESNSRAYTLECNQPGSCSCACCLYKVIAVDAEVW